MRLHLLVHQRLRDHRLVLLVVAELAVADDVDHDILLEGVTELHRHLGDERHGFRIVAVDVEDRRVGHLEDVGAVQRGAVVTRVRRGEADLVVHHDVHRAARAVTAGLREVDHFLVDALAGDGGVAMDQHRQHLVLAAFAAPTLARVNRADDDRVDDFQVRGVESQRQVAGAAGRRDVGRVAHVVLDVAGRQVLRLLAFELVEEHRRRLAQRIDEHVETAAVGHADDDLIDAESAADADQFVHRHDQRFAAFEREALLADVAGVQVALERLGGRQAFEQTLLLVGAVAALAADRFEAILQPAFLGDLVHVHVLDADRAAVGFLQRVEDLAERRMLGNGLEGARVEGAVEVGVGQAVVRGLELGQCGTRHALERVEVGPARAEEAVGVDQLQHADLLLVVDRRSGRHAVAALLRLLGEGVDHWQMRHVAGNVARQLRQFVEIVAPLVGHGSGIV